MDCISAATRESDWNRESKTGTEGLEIPVIDMGGVIDDSARRAKIVDQIGNACREWGFFQVVNHGIPVTTLDEMIEGIRAFNEEEEPPETKRELYTRDQSKKRIYHTRIDVSQGYSRDRLVCVMAPHPPAPEELPAACREILLDYKDNMMNLGLTLFELLSESLGLESSYLKDIGCAEGLFFKGHYLPAYPKPDLTTMATISHTDSSFITVLLQDQIGGLQILHDDQWIDVTPIHGALIVNVGDLLQLITNDKYISVFHRVLAKNVGPRISIASFFRTYIHPDNGEIRNYGPIRELISKQNPPLYKETNVVDYYKFKNFEANGAQGTSALAYFKL